jgi:hypothetical protein
LLEDQVNELLADLSMREAEAKRVHEQSWPGGWQKED